jgi:hypothetical protein
MRIEDCENSEFFFVLEVSSVRVCGVKIVKWWYGCMRAVVDTCDDGDGRDPSDNVLVQPGDRLALISWCGFCGEAGRGIM